MSELHMVDGREALAYVLIKPGSSPEMLSIDAAAIGITKSGAALVLHQIADAWTAEDGVHESDTIGQLVAAARAFRADLVGPYVDPGPVCLEDLPPDRSARTQLFAAAMKVAP